MTREHKKEKKVHPIRRTSTWIGVTILSAVSALFITWTQGFGEGFLEEQGISGRDQGERAAAPNPFSVVDIRSTSAEGGDYFLPRAPGAAAPTELESGQATDDWLSSNAIPVGNSKWEVTIQSNRTKEVQIVDIRPRLDGGRCDTPTPGDLIERKPAGGGPQPKILLWVDITKTDPAFRAIDDTTGKPREFYFDTHKVSLTKYTPETIVIDAHATTGLLCMFDLEVSYIADQQKGTAIIKGPGGRKFSLAGLLDYDQYQAIYLSGLYCNLAASTTGPHLTKVSIETARYRISHPNPDAAC